MNLVIYSPLAYQKFGHGYDYVQGLGRALSKRQVNVHVLGWDGPLRLPSGIIEHRLPASRMYTTRNRYGRFGPGRQLMWGASRTIGGGYLLSALHRLHSSLEAPYVLFESFEYITLSLFLRMNRRLADKASCIFHDTNFNAEHHSLVAKLYKSAVRPNVRAILRCAHTVYVHGPVMKENLLRTFGNRGEDSIASRVQVIPYGAPHPEELRRISLVEARETLGFSRDAKLLLAFGTLRRDKKFEFILQGLRDCSDWQLLVVGPEGRDFSYREIEDLARRYCVEAQIKTVRGFVPPEEHGLYFGAADAVVNIYDESVRHESGTAQKARTFLKPIIVGGSPDLIDYVTKYNIGWAVDLSRPDSLSRVLREVASLTERDLLDLQRNIYRCAEERSWDSVAEIVLEYSLGQVKR